eukprot:scaffold76561_cov62-Phaeocystis_antarctica.AAC.10
MARGCVAVDAAHSPRGEHVVAIEDGWADRIPAAAATELLKPGKGAEKRRATPASEPDRPTANEEVDQHRINV